MIKTITPLFLTISLLSLLECHTPNTIEVFLQQQFEQGKLNGNVLIVKNNEILCDKSFGYAEGTKTNLLQPDYRFMIGSIYKEFPAVSIMQLQEQGKLHINDTLAKFLPDLPVWSDSITLKNLLQYASGLPTINFGAFFQNGIPLNEENILKSLQDIEQLAFVPGADYIYSNYNPILLMRIIEQVTGQTFQKYVEQHLFQSYDLDGIIIKNHYPYQDKTLMAIPFNTTFEEDNITFSLASICASTNGLYQWFQQLGDFKIISKESMKILSETAKIGDNIQAPLGFCEWKGDKLIEHAHHGSSGNYECLVQRYKQDDLTIVLLTNQKHRNLHKIATNIYSIVMN